ncbi:MAG: MFS transporter [Bacteroidales bacterium]
MRNKAISLRLIIMNFLQYAIWGAYLTSMGSYLFGVGLSSKIGIFYAMQGIVSIFMPALIGIIADKYMPAQKVLSLCHGLAGLFMLASGFYAMSAGGDVQFSILFTLYSLSVGFYMPTIALSNSVAYNVLESEGKDTVKAFPPIRVFGTIGFICSMLFVNFMKNGDGIQFQLSYNQFLTSGSLGILLALYSLTLPNCPAKAHNSGQSFIETSGLKAFTLFKDRQMAIFFIFSMCLGVALQITNGFANPFITSFKESADPMLADSFGARNANALISISQVSETLCILLIPFFMKKFGIKIVMVISMFAWVFRFGLFGAGNPGPGVWMFILSMIVYGVAFDFFNISGSLYVNKKTSEDIRSSAQGLFMLMTNGFGATIGTLGAQAVINHFVYNAATPDWSTAWYIFAGYALVVAILFIILFRDPRRELEKDPLKA